MFKGNFYYLCLFVLLVIISPITVPLKDDERNLFNSEALKNYYEEDIRSKTTYESAYEVKHALKKDVWILKKNTGNQTQTLAETLRRSFYEFEELFENILDIVATNVPKISRDAEAFLAKFSNRTLDVLNTFSDKILNTGDNLLNEIFHNVERQLKSVKLEFQNLAKSVDENFNWAVGQLNHTLINNTEEYDWWTAYIKQKLRKVNDTKLYQEGCLAIDDFITSSSKKLHSCCKITMKPMRSLCKSANSLIIEALNTIVNAIDRMQHCLEEKKSYLNYMLPCINLAYDELSSLISQAAQITHQINNMLPMKIIYTRSCFAIVKVEMNVRRNNIESNLFSI